mgnify:CR=1 FL=1
MRKALLYTGALGLVLLLALVVTAEYFSHRERRFTGQVVDALPRNALGKVIKTELRQRAATAAKS